MSIQSLLTSVRNSKIINKLRIQKVLIKYIFSNNNNTKYKYLQNKQKCIIFLSADYGNLGDVAITYSQHLWLQNKYPNYEIIEIPVRNTISELKALKNICNENDIITLIGGGNFGDLYNIVEILRQLIISKFKKNKIISFPQSISYSQTAGGDYLLKRARTIFLGHHNLEIWSRDSLSFEISKKYFSQNTLKLLPDIVLTLDETDINSYANREGVIMCLRNDKEVNINNANLILEIKKQIHKENYSIEYCDTDLGNIIITQEEQKKYLNTIWNKFRKAKLIVTDRLHGMIFAFITGTPAIILPCNNPKIEMCFEWIKECCYIDFIMKEDEINISKLICSKNIINNFKIIHEKLLHHFNFEISNTK